MKRTLIALALIVASTTVFADERKIACANGNQEACEQIAAEEEREQRRDGHDERVRKGLETLFIYIMGNPGKG